jgi:UDP-N-acetylmuramate: L-alanyl-gamma-D-glutamyl-meso-diaminopimelate ligase
MAAAAAITAGVPPATAFEVMARFPGVARRMEVVGEASGVTVVDDFAHHPTAIEVTVAAARQRWPNRRLVIAFEPRSLTAARRSFEGAYLKALAGADVVMVTAPYHRDRLDESELLDRTALAEGLAGCGVVPVMPADDEDPVAILAEVVVEGDVVVGCSSGDFGGFHNKLITVLTSGGEG